MREERPLDGVIRTAPDVKRPDAAPRFLDVGRE
jgi:hypothetical protein